jgi:hypothetical protein
VLRKDTAGRRSEGYLISENRLRVLVGRTAFRRLSFPTPIGNPEAEGVTGWMPAFAEITAWYVP